MDTYSHPSSHVPSLSRLAPVLTEYFYSRDFTPAARDWYEQKLGVFVRWCQQHDLDDLASLTRAHLRQFSRDLRESPSVSTGKPIASRTLHGYIRAVKSLLNWAVNEGYIDERLTRKLEMPKLEEKIVAT